MARIDDGQHSQAIQTEVAVAPRRVPHDDTAITASLSHTPAPVPRTRERLVSIDILRGAIMAIMTLDHVRDYFTQVTFNTMDPEVTTPAHFFTRWITHFCAPAFFLLAGIGASLSLSRGKSHGDFARDLVVRGLLLIALDLVVVRVAWDFNLDFDGGLWFIVLSTLGFSMIALAGLSYLPRAAVIVFTAALILGHNAFDWVNADHLGIFEPLWIFLHVKRGGDIYGYEFYVTYPLIPWVAVMSLGFLLGPVFQLEGAERRRMLMYMGLAMIGLFVLLRLTNAYGNPRNFYPRYPDWQANVMAFLRVKKYPPSLHYCCMTLGPILISLAVLDRVRLGKAGANLDLGTWGARLLQSDAVRVLNQMAGVVLNWLVNFGRAPLFFYILHVYVIHALALVTGVLMGFEASEFCVRYTRLPWGYGFSLAAVYGFWLLVLILCYPLCLWFDRLKRNTKSVWLSYL